MTVAAELAKDAQWLEYFVTIEGIGWPSTWKDLSDGFSGTVWATADLNGDIAAKLGCTVKFGLDLPGEISDSVDPKTASYEVSGMNFTIVDENDEQWWRQNFTPRATDSSESSLENAVKYSSLTIDIADGVGFNTLDNVWIGGRELVKLGFKAIIGGGPAYRFSTSGRARRGSQRGSSLRRPGDYWMGHWPAGTTVGTIARYWWNRKIALWAHVPGEAVENCYLLWFGRLRQMKSDAMGVSYDFSCVSDLFESFARTTRPREWTVFVDEPHRLTYNNDLDLQGITTGALLYTQDRHIRFGQPFDTGSNWSNIDDGKYAMALAYRYRCEPGGLEGAVTAWDAGLVQALDTTNDNDVLGSFVLIGDQLQWLQKKDDLAGADPKSVKTSIISKYVGVSPELISTKQERGETVICDGAQSLTYGLMTKARFLLHNFGYSIWYNRFHIGMNAGAVVSRNPVNLLLFFMTSMDESFARGDCIGGGTTSVIKFAAVPGGNNFWVGKWLFGMEGNHKWQVREITANDRTDITVKRAFVGAYAAGVEYQIRNSEFDTLPCGWGLGVDTDYLDLDSFRKLRDKYYPDTQVDEFIIGVNDDIDIFDFLKENILRPYGILLYLDRASRKVKARYMSTTPNIDEIEDYIQISDSDIVDPGEINSHFTNPVGSAQLAVRSYMSRVVEAKKIHLSQNAIDTRIEATYGWVPGLMDGSQDKIILRTTEIESAFSDTDIEKVEFTAMFDTMNTLNSVIDHILGVCGNYSVPPHVWNPALAVKRWTDLTPGVWAAINWATYPTNPLDGSRGWSNVVGRLLNSTLPLDGRTLACQTKFELFLSLDRGIIAPAATVTSKGNDGTYDYFVVNDTDYVMEEDDDKDWWHFTAGDLIELRDATGALKEAETIISFGSNHKTDPTEAADARINVVNGGIASGIVADDYVTFQPWSGGSTAHMKTFSAYADAAGALTGGDTARKYQ